MEKLNRKELKTRAKAVVKSHYWILMIVCLTAAVIGSSFSGSLEFLKITKDDTSTETVSESAGKTGQDSPKGDIKNGFGYGEIVNSIMENNLTRYEENTKKSLSAQEAKRQESFGALKIGRSRGLLAVIVNNVQSGSLYIMIIVTLQTLFHSKELGSIFFVLLSFLLIAAVYVLFIGTFQVVYSRIFLEARSYEKVPYRKFLYLIRTRSLFRVARVCLVTTIYLFFWSLTIVGGFIKTYAYYMVPYILAENPRLNSKQAITLSRRMMKGHKWECFVLDISFILWYLLSVITFGLVRLFWLNSYKTATMTEYYAKLRQDYIHEKKEGYEYFNDTYLYEHATKESLQEAYSDVFELKDEPRFEYVPENPIRRFFQNVFGVVLYYDENERKRREQEVRDANLRNLEDVIEGKVYPGRLSAIEKNEKMKSLENLRYLRCYSVLSVIVIFFMFCIIGWLWEVSLHLITDGNFVNRGVLHGPWLPIYGTGGTMILLLLYRFREKPWLEFLTAVILAGAVEYFTSWQLEMSHGGTQWWNYDNYYLNINGRVCAEGLLVFGLGGVAVVYFLAPLIDNLANRIRVKVLAPICICLLLIYSVDLVYSHFHPNSGKGITDYESEIQTPEDSPGDSLSYASWRIQSL